ncbi:hypothetical protein PV327_009601 [Microctonus hyperodae]|uniref:Uncharacterized protein n=1 Tax=Microctonus hyperodae TaxID=165561 RepID=A0AA39F189_MICHY|nr:hypothetical protein PV327_009601 [Microctonus hyperodae]
MHASDTMKCELHWCWSRWQWQKRRSHVSTHHPVFVPSWIPTPGVPIHTSWRLGVESNCDINVHHVILTVMCACEFWRPSILCNSRHTNSESLCENMEKRILITDIFTRNLNEHRRIRATEILQKEEE